MKKIVSLLVAMCFSLSAFAATGSIQAFESALDQYNYAMNVQWDQRDMAFKEAKTKELVERMQGLMSNGSVTQEDVLAVVSRKVNNRQVVENLRFRMHTSGGFATNDELINFITESSDDFYAHGASWSGRTAAGFAIGALVALVFAMWFSATHGCEEYAQTCDWAGCRNDYDRCVDYGYVGPHL